MSKLYAVAEQQKSNQQEAREAVQAYREKQDDDPRAAPSHAHGLTVGERFNHRGWPPEVVRAFLDAPIIKPAEGQIQEKLYGMVNRV